MRELLAFITLGAIVVGGVVLFLGGFIYAEYLWEKHVSCPNFAIQIERPYRYSWLAGGCFVQTTNGQWVAKKNYWNNPVLTQ